MEKINRLTLLSLLLLGLLSTGCKKKIKVEGPAETNREVNLETPSSQLMLPVSLSTQEIAGLLNQELNGVFFDEWMQVNKEGDSLHLRLERSDLALLKWNGMDLLTDFPLRVEATYVKEVFGMRLKNPEPVTAEAILQLRSGVQLSEDWRLLTQTQLLGIQWKKNPELKLGPLKIDVKKPVESALRDNQDQLLKNLDKVLSEEIKLKDLLQKIWTDMQKPILLHEERPEAYLIPKPESVQARLEATETGDIAIRLYLDARLEAVEGPLPAFTPSLLPNLTTSNNQSEGIHLFIKASLGFEQANALLNENLSGKEIRSGDYGLQIKEARLYGIEEGLAMQLNVGGSLNGTLFFTGKIAYDEETLQFFVDDLNYDLATDNYLLESANQLFYQQVIAYLEPRLRFNAAPLADEIPELILNALDQSGLSDKMELQLEDFTIRPHEMAVDRKGIQAVIQSSMKASLKLKEII